MRNIITVAAFIALLGGCQQPQESDSSQTQTDSIAVAGNQPPAAAGPEIGDWGVDLDNRKPDVRPGDDFFVYASGHWLETYELPADKTSFGSFTALHDQSQERVRDLVNELSDAQPQAGSVEQKIGDYYSSFLDQATIDAIGVEPLAEDLKAISEISDLTMLVEAFGRSDLSGTTAPITFGIEIDRMNPDRWIAGVGLGGMGLPDRDYYLDESERFVDIRNAYVANIEALLTLAGYENAAEAAPAILAVETAIAETQWPRAERRNRDLTYNLMSLEDFEAAYPGIPWRPFMKASGAVPEELNVRYPSTVQPLVELVTQTDMETWRAYLTYHLVVGNSFALAAEIDEARFDFFSRTLRGQPEQRERWRRGVSLVGGRSGLGDAIGQVYVQRYFPAESKAMMEELVENLREALRQRIAGLDWMTEETKEYAFEKLAAFTPNIGYPNKWRDFSGISIDGDNLMSNVRQLRALQREIALDRLNRPTDREEWFMTPQTVNAYYVAQFNSITFPAGILAPPFFDPAADPAVNYGAIGAVIGHEMGHGFDDQGSKSDARGVQRNWWTDEDRARFEERAARLAEQYSAYEPVEGTFIDGEFTVGENIGDLGGLNVAYHAYKLSLNGAEPPIIDGLTGDQRFFLAYAQVWRSKTRDEALVSRLKSGPHSPAEFRVNGVVRNMDAWYAAFDVQPDDALYLPPEERVSIW